jgi:spore photoproduct lyase
MSEQNDYSAKFESFKNRTLFEKLGPDQQAFLTGLASNLQLTFQEFRLVVEAARDLSMWGGEDLKDWWSAQALQSGLSGRQLKDHVLQRLKNHMNRLRSSPKTYPRAGLFEPKERERKLISTEQSTKKIYGKCPVASDKTVCCNLHTIDAVERCVFGCSYCTVQTFYGDKIVFDENFAEKLRAVSLDPERFYHFGTGQASDSLAFGNRNGILDALCQFARDYPNILLEFKTKSNNVRYFLENEIPENCVCSWSLNTTTIINNEEHFTASLEQRLEAARLVADRGVKIAFHFHPMVYYQGWDNEYAGVASRLLSGFEPEDVLFVSLGTVTFIKPVIQKIRELGRETKILQMELVSDPHGKVTYPDKIKIMMFNSMLEAFEAWKDEVFMYLCMEKPIIWEKTTGSVYRNNEEFEEDFAIKTMRKLNRQATKTLRGNFHTPNQETQPSPQT